MTRPDNEFKPFENDSQEHQVSHDEDGVLLFVNDMNAIQLRGDLLIEKNAKGIAHVQEIMRILQRIESTILTQGCAEKNDGVKAKHTQIGTPIDMRQGHVSVFPTTQSDETPTPSATAFRR
jgi:hypothetical protein